MLKDEPSPWPLARQQRLEALREIEHLNANYREFVSNLLVGCCQRERADELQDVTTLNLSAEPQADPRDRRGSMSNRRNSRRGGLLEEIDMAMCASASPPTG